MEEAFDLTTYLNKGSESLIADILRSTLRNPKETLFLQRYHSCQPGMEARRMAHEAEGLHIPLFLIASITSACNLYCKGCYARANGQCGQQKGTPLSRQEWSGVFSQAEAAGISFILLAGGEPFLRMDVLEAAAEKEGIIFPIFTNGTVMGPDALQLLDRHRNLVPVVSLEGGQDATDDRRGEGAYQVIRQTFEHLSARKLLFGTSITVTTQNMAEVTDPAFVQDLYDQGCRLLFYIEYVPVAPGTEALAPDDAARTRMEQAQAALRAQYPGMVFLAFPGDEKYMGGCLAAGRGFFHINATGGAEPCPFSPYSDGNVRDHTLLEVLQSPFFRKVRALNEQESTHAGGCTLFAQEAQVRSLLFP